NAIHAKNWVEAIKRLLFTKSLFKPEEVPMTLLIRLSMLYRIIGYKNKDNFHEIVNTYKNEVEKDINGYRRITLYDNGDTRIEYYKKLKAVSKVVITFDSINMVWGNPPFGYK